MPARANNPASFSPIATSAHAARSADCTTLGRWVGMPFRVVDGSAGAEVRGHSPALHAGRPCRPAGLGPSVQSSVGCQRRAASLNTHVRATAGVLDLGLDHAARQLSAGPRRSATSRTCPSRCPRAKSSPRPTCCRSPCLLWRGVRPIDRRRYAACWCSGARCWVVGEPASVWLAPGRDGSTEIDVWRRLRSAGWPMRIGRSRGARAWPSWTPQPPSRRHGPGRRSPARHRPSPRSPLPARSGGRGSVRPGTSPAWMARFSVISDVPASGRRPPRYRCRCALTPE